MPEPDPTGPHRGTETIIAGALVVTIVAAAGLAVTYWVGGQPQWEGALLGLSLGGLALSLGIWGHSLLPGAGAVQERERLASTAEEQRAFVDDFLAGEQAVSRRRLLTGLLMGGLGTLGLAALFPIRSLGPNIGRALRRTEWEAGKRVVGVDGKPVRASDLGAGEVLTVFPEGYTSPADSQAMLIRVEPGLLQLPADRAAWAPNGLVAYSKVCTHAGCPVGLYDTVSHQLLCPCHQSLFDVLHGAQPVFGPATRPLPQLPLAIDADGYLVARGDFPEPIGPGFWSERT